MGVKTCCILYCQSCSTRKEDIGVTYHKYPKDVALRDTWLSVTRHKQFNLDTTSYVCSRHFCKGDFQVYKDSKYVLKSDAVPSIFSWITETKEMDLCQTSSENIADGKDLSNNSKESESEQCDALKILEAQEKKLYQQYNQIYDTDMKEKKGLVTEKFEANTQECDKMQESMAVATSLMDLILSDSELKMFHKKDRSFDKQCVNLKEKGNNGSMDIGSKVEVRDFEEFWHPAEIVEVDYDEKEVLIRYSDDLKKHDEWINISSARLNPLSSITTRLPSEVKHTETLKLKTNIVNEDDKQQEKVQLKFVVGERCLARWKDNRRFMATITKDLDNGSYEIVFDDGFQWKCNTNRLYKLKESPRSLQQLTIDTSSTSSTSAIPSPILYGTDHNSLSPALNTSHTPFHTHLFDPTRDYLGSKSERREKKRKLNIKEIFNIGQKKRKKQRSLNKNNASVATISKQRRPWSVQNEIKRKFDVKTIQEVEDDISDAVGSIINTVAKEDELKKELIFGMGTESSELDMKTIEDGDNKNRSVRNNNDKEGESVEEESLLKSKNSLDPVLEEETKLENFEPTDDCKHEEEIDRLKEVIIKLQDGIDKAARIDSPICSVTEDNKLNTIDQDIAPEFKEENQLSIEKLKLIKTETDEEKVKTNMSTLKNAKNFKLRKKRDRKQFEKVKNDLKEMKRQFAEIKKQLDFRKELQANSNHNKEKPRSLLPDEWCCKWVNGKPVGNVSEIEDVKSYSNGKPSLPRCSVEVEDKRLPEGWTKHLIRRSLGTSAGKWDVVLVSPGNRRFHSKMEMRTFLENDASVYLKQYENVLLDFGIHTKLSRQMGWVTNTNAEESVKALPSGIRTSISPRMRMKKRGINRVRRIMKLKEQRRRWAAANKRRIQSLAKAELPGTSSEQLVDSPDLADDDSRNEEGYVHVGSLKVQVIDNLLRCPAEGCFKNFRNKILLKMHMKHYHRELHKLLGDTPQVLDLAYARTKPKKTEMTKMKNEIESKIIKVKILKQQKCNEDKKMATQELDTEFLLDIPCAQVEDEKSGSKPDEWPKLRSVLTNKPVKSPKVLLPVRKLEKNLNEGTEDLEQEMGMNISSNIPTVEILDFENAISTHTVTKPSEFKKKVIKGFTTFVKKTMSEDEELLTMNSDMETMSSFPGSGTPDSRQTVDKIYINEAASSESNDDQKDAMYTYTETGERIKIVQMKREEIINCHCGYREEDGLMMQCELCLCWQHALCHGIQRESEVPEKYTCSICLKPRRGRRSKRFLHDQDWMYEGMLVGAKPCDALRRSHELAGNLLRVQDVLHALRVKYYVATKKNHPKLYLWAKDWENSEQSVTQERWNSGYSDLNVIINNIGKENFPMETDDIDDMKRDVRKCMEENDGKFNHRDMPIGSQTQLSGLLSAPSAASLELTLNQNSCVKVPQPEAAIENSVCRENLLLHIQRCQELVDARLDSIEAQVAELESQDPSFEDDETADFCPRTKQTIQMLMRDLDTMEELGVIT